MFVETLEAFFGAGLWAVIKAVLILLLAFIVSAVVNPRSQSSWQRPSWVREQKDRRLATP